MSSGVQEDYFERILAPGRYRLELHHSGYEGRTSEFDVTVAIPEPSTALLTGLGLAGSCAGRRRQSIDML